MTIRFSIFAGRLVLACAALAGLWSAPASAQTPAAGLPIAEGAWVDVAEPCGRAINGHVYAGYRWGDFSQWGDGQVGAGADPITSLARVEGGFIRINGGPIEVKLTEGPRYVRWAVSDKGLGIPAGERRRIFEKFYRLDPNMTRGIGGTGLGLYICHELIRRLDGRIWVEPRRGKGSTFYVELPAAQRPARTERARAVA